MTHWKVKTLVKEGSMPAEKWTPERRRQLTREALVASARDVFANRGFHAASLEEIADEAGFTAGPSIRTSRTKRNSSSPFLIVTWNCKPPPSTPSSKKLAVRSPHLMRTSRVCGAGSVPETTPSGLLSTLSFGCTPFGTLMSETDSSPATTGTGTESSRTSQRSFGISTANC